MWVFFNICWMYPVTWCQSNHSHTSFFNLRKPDPVGRTGIDPRNRYLSAHVSSWMCMCNYPGVVGMWNCGTDISQEKLNLKSDSLYHILLIFQDGNSIQNYQPNDLKKHRNPASFTWKQCGMSLLNEPSFVLLVRNTCLRATDGRLMGLLFEWRVTVDASKQGACFQNGNVSKKDPQNPLDILKPGKKT